MDIWNRHGDLRQFKTLIMTPKKTATDGSLFKTNVTPVISGVHSDGSEGDACDGGNDVENSPKTSATKSSMFVCLRLYVSSMLCVCVFERLI